MAFIIGALFFLAENKGDRDRCLTHNRSLDTKGPSGTKNNYRVRGMARGGLGFGQVRTVRRGMIRCERAEVKWLRALQDVACGGVTLQSSFRYTPTLGARFKSFEPFHAGD